MTDKEMNDLLNNNKINTKKRVIDEDLFFILDHDSDWFLQGNCEYFIFLKYNKLTVGIIRYMAFDNDIHCFIKEEYRNLHILSTFFKNINIKNYFEDLTECSCIHEEDEITLKKVKYLAKLAGLKFVLQQDKLDIFGKKVYE